MWDISETCTALGHVIRDAMPGTDQLVDPKLSENLNLVGPIGLPPFQTPGSGVQEGWEPHVGLCLGSI